MKLFRFAIPTIFFALSAALSPRSVSAQVESLYWIERQDADGIGVIVRAESDGSDVTTLYSASYENGFDVMGVIALGPTRDYLYFSEIRSQHTAAFFRLAVDSGEKDLIVERTVPFIYVMQMAVIGDDEDLLILEDWDGASGIERISIDSGVRLAGLKGDEFTWVTSFAPPSSESLYFSRGGDTTDHSNGIYRTALDGSVVDLLVKDVIATSIAVDEARGHLYWTSRDGGLFRSSIDGSDVHALIDGETLSVGSTVVEGILYWTDHSTNTLYRSHADSLITTQGESAVAIHVSDRARGQVVVYSSQTGSSIEVAPGQPVRITTYPNPVNDILTVRIGDFTGTVRVVLYDLSGRHVQTLMEGVVFQGQTVHGDVSGLPAGAYLLRVLHDRGSESAIVHVLR
jgi:hypothetical protein